ncbi:MAG: excinuclease ABC subunit UvrA [Bacteroidales bacterium]|nr:excinuclease ABC subunit UvrA [Bacteroidales bacterium]
MTDKELDNLDPKKNIIIKGAHMHNLKNLSVAIPRRKFVVITGLSGSGKSSLAFDTLYAEGQRRYVESLSSYARQFMGRMTKPEVEYIKGIAPAIAIEQKVNTRNPRSTVGTSTEIYEYLKLLYARIGKTYSPVSGNQVKRHKVSDVVDFILSLKEKSKISLFSPLILNKDRSLKDQLNVILQQGFSRIRIGDQIERIDKILNKDIDAENICILIDRLVINSSDEDLASRIADSAQTAFFEGKGVCIINYETENGVEEIQFSNLFELDGITFEEPIVDFFSFNNPYGACKACEGFGSVVGIDTDLVIPNKNLSIFEEAIACWKGDKMGEWKDTLIRKAQLFDFPIHKPFYLLTETHKQLLWTGNEHFEGLNAFFKQIEEQSYKIQYRVMLSRYRGKTTCPDCKSSRLRKDAQYVKIANKTITDIVLMPVTEAYDFFNTLEFDEHDQQIANRLLTEINNRLKFLVDVGLGYLTLNRNSNTLSGGESQRINLATSLGSSLVGSMYILDEPSIGLHSRDTQRLIDVLKQLRDLGNTVIVVEHDEDIIKAADEIIDIGPGAGRHGGNLVFSGSYKDILLSEESITGKYMTGSMKIPIPTYRRKWKDYIEVIGATENNLKNLAVKFPLDILSVVTGVSGSGKTTLVKSILYPAIQKMLGGYGDKTGQHALVRGETKRIEAIEMVDQNPIGKSSRSNPATYVKAFDEIRALYADLGLSKTRKYKPGFFSFNVPGGRCEECEGEGIVKVEMQFMADIHYTCESCKGKRFKTEVLEVVYRDKNIADILEMTINQAIEFFGQNENPSAVERRIIQKLTPLKDVGLGYLQLGQSSSTLSGGEAQRIKLAFFLTKGQNEKTTLFIFDEPTTGLHFHDINKLLKAFNALIENGHSLIVIEHNYDIIKCADWVIDLGPEGGDLGGNIVYEGTPENMTNIKDSYTAFYLEQKLSEDK